MLFAFAYHQLTRAVRHLVTWIVPSFMIRGSFVPAFPKSKTLLFVHTFSIISMSVVVVYPATANFQKLCVLLTRQQDVYFDNVLDPANRVGAKKALALLDGGLMSPSSSCSRYQELSTPCYGQGGGACSGCTLDGRDCRLAATASPSKSKLRLLLSDPLSQRILKAALGLLSMREDSPYRLRGSKAKITTSKVWALGGPFLKVMELDGDSHQVRIPFRYDTDSFAAARG